jgi:hypothetical protein
MLKGSLLAAKYADYEPDFPAQVRTAAQQAGITYERSTIKRLKSLYAKVEHGPWLHYRTDRKSGICQPDALVWLTEDHLLIVECKLSWLRSARPKLLQFYGPIVQAIHPAADLSYLQIYKNAKPDSHKRKISIYDLDNLPKGSYKECQHLT